MSRQAISRKTDAASELETFLDSEADNLSPYMFDELEKVAETIDETVSELEESIDTANDEIEDLQSEIESLERRIDELEDEE